MGTSYFYKHTDQQCSHMECTHVKTHMGKEVHTQPAQITHTYIVAHTASLVDVDKEMFTATHTSCVTELWSVEDR